MKVQSYALEQQAIEREQRMKQLRNETEQLKKENARLSELDAKLNAILSNSGTSSTPPNAMPGESEMGSTPYPQTRPSLLPADETQQQSP